MALPRRWHLRAPTADDLEAVADVPIAGASSELPGMRVVKRWDLGERWS